MDPQYDLDSAIEASLKEYTSRATTTLPENVSPVSNLTLPENSKPPDPPSQPPRTGMTLKTVIKNGWVTKEWC